MKKKLIDVNSRNNNEMLIFKENHNTDVLIISLYRRNFNDLFPLFQYDVYNVLDLVSFFKSTHFTVF